MNKAPWTDHEVKLLKIRQEEENMHPYTCDRESPNCEKKKDWNKDGVLIPTKEGWICPCGDFKQDWYYIEEKIK